MMERREGIRQLVMMHTEYRIGNMTPERIEETTDRIMTIIQ